MPRLTDAVRQQRREQIADAALRCFARDGFAGTSMADIIAEAGLSSGSIYSHFDSKVDLARFAAAEMFASLQSALTAEIDHLGVPGPDAVFGQVFDLLTTHAGSGMLLQLWGEAQQDPELAAIAREKMTLIRAALAETLSPWAGSPERAAQTASLVLAAVQGSVVRLGVEPDTNPAELRDDLAAALRLLRH